MQGIENLSDRQIEIVKKILKEDNGFHSTKLIADYPFAAIAKETENGLQYINPHCSFSVSSGGASYDVTFRYSQELNVWFFSVEWSDGRFDGIVHFNTVYNPQGLCSFVFLNDSSADDSDSVGRNLQFSNFIVMVK